MGHEAERLSKQKNIEILFFFSIFIAKIMASPRRGVDDTPTNGSKEGEIDREKVCPLLLRVFCANSRHNNLTDYNRGKVPPNELQIYTWMDASLKELMSLVREVNPESRKKGTYFDFAIISPAMGRGNYQNGQTCHYVSRDIGTTVSGTKGLDDNKTLAQARFVIGDYIDIAITPPNPSGGRPHHRLDRMNDRGDPRDRDHRDGDNRRWGGGRQGGFGGDRDRGGFGDRDRGFGDRSGGNRGFGDRDRRRPY